jgi:hypothetical protein
MCYTQAFRVNDEVRFRLGCAPKNVSNLQLRHDIENVSNLQLRHDIETPCDTLV